MITKKLHSILSAEIDKLLKEYEEFREKLAKDPLQSNALDSAIKEEEKIWEIKIAAAKSKIKNLKVVTPGKQNNFVAFGSQVVVSDKNGKKNTIILDGAWYQFPDKTQAINCQTPLAKKLMGKKPGDIVDGKTIISTKCPWW